LKRCIIPTAEPFLLPGGPTGCLLVHGYTGTPKEMRGLGEYLNQRGQTVLGLRLAGHATQPKDLIRARKDDWLADLEDGWCLLDGMCERIFIAGLSLGGILALVFASTHAVSGVVAMSAPHHLPADPRLPFIKPLSILLPYIPKDSPDWCDPHAAEGHVCYPTDPTRGYAEVRNLLKDLHLALPQIHAPALLVYARGDQTVKPQDGHAQQMLSEIGGMHKSLVWVENSGHVITRDAGKEQVFQVVSEFIHRWAGKLK
jgi:carboxylesterase